MTKSLKAVQFMTEQVIAFPPEMDITDAIFELAELEVSGAPVVDGQGRLVGILTERDCLAPFLQASYHGQPGGPISDFMTREVHTIGPETEVLEVARLFAETKFRRFPVVEGNRMIGLVSRRDALRALLSISYDSKAT